MLRHIKSGTPVLLGMAAFVILMAGIIYAKSVINPLLMAFFVSSIFVQPIVWLKRKKVPHGIAIFLMLIVIVAFYVGIFEMVLASLSLFIQDAPILEENLKEIASASKRFIDNQGMGSGFMEGSHAIAPSKLLQTTTSIVAHLKEVLSSEVTFIFLTVFLLAEIESVFLKVKFLSLNSNLSPARMNSIGSSIRNYMSIKTLTSLATGILVGVSLSLVGLDYPILWGLLAFLLNYIPTIGSIMAAIPAVIISYIQLGMPQTYWTIGIFVVVNVVIGSVLEPRIMGKGLGLSTFVVFFSLIFWGMILGPVGMFLSIPITMVIKIIMENFPETKWVAIILGPKEDVEAALEE